MRFWHTLVRVLVFACASFFAVMGVLILFLPITGRGKPIEPGQDLEKAMLGVVFLLAALPMYYYVFSKNIARLNPPRAKKKGPGHGHPGQPPSGPAAP